MAQRSVSKQSMSDVSPGMEVSGINTDSSSSLTLSYNSELPPLPESLSRLSLYDTLSSNKPEPALRQSPKPSEYINSFKQLRQPQLSHEHSDLKRPIDKPPVPPRKPSSVDIKLAHLRSEMGTLRQMDLQLLSQLRQLNDSISLFRQELLNMDTYLSSDTDESDTTSIYSNVTPSSLELSRSSTQSLPKQPPTTTDL
ncbi:leucine repeat adapter protein 25-like [Daktulosphaira vitifoliae]|uniref:leucine repeat adapter protein 25-like n=1 Tax=Daktulosphaira vitifoliae TaxID=58002 RepID=UPI0021AA7EBD|nr:leucine repeat adapter protein 25-like [Daktulosphaira vitifoliae]